MEDEWSRKKKKKGWDILLNKEGLGKRGREEISAAGMGEARRQKPHEQNDVYRVPQYFL